MRPIALAFGELGDVGNRLGRVLGKQAADDGSFGGFKPSVESGLACREVLSSFVVSGEPKAFARNYPCGERRPRLPCGKSKGLFSGPSSAAGGTT